MKVAIGLAVLIWLLCGLAGAWMTEEPERPRAELIARGPLTLIDALNEEPPVRYPEAG